MKLRRYSPDDCEMVLKLFYDTVHSINAADYAAEQLIAWAPIEADNFAWNNRLSDNYTVVVEKDGGIIGFGSADDNGYFDLLYTHKDYQKIGAATLIADDIEKHLACMGSILSQQTPLSQQSHSLKKEDILFWRSKGLSAEVSCS